jgi:hypothetical protein
VRIELLRAGTAVLSVASAAPNIGSYSWTVPAGIEAGTDYTMRVTALQASDVSDAPFAMAAAITSEVSWTLLVYVDAENNLEGEAIDDLLEMARIGSGTQVKVIVQMDRIPGYDSRFGDWTGTKRFLVTSGMQPTSASALQDLGELDTGSATTLADFIVWGMGAYPAQNYALVLWDHGGGVSGACWDDTSNTHLSVPDLRRSLQMAAEASGKHLDLIGFDACLMSMAEVAYEIRDYADCLVSSEEVEPGNGWPYDTVLSYLASNSGIDADQFGTAIVERYIVSYAASGSETLSAVDLSKMAPLKTALSALADVLIAKMSSVRGLLSSSLSAAQAYEYPTNLDLVDLCDEIIRRTADTEVRTAASTVREAAMAAVVAERHNAERPGSHGLAIYFPATQEDYRSTYDALRMTLEGTWDDLLRNYYSGPRLNDAFEPDDSPAQASTLVPGQVQTHSIGAVGRDVDWMRFTTTGVANVIVQTSGPEGDTRLWLYSSGDLNNPLAFNDDHTDRFSRISITSLPAGTYLVKVDEYGQNEDIPTYEVSLSVTQTAGNWVEVRSPNGAERLSQGMTLQLTWATSASITGGMKLELLRGEQVVLSIASAANNNGTYAWTVPYGITPADDYVLRVMSAGGVKDVSDRPFSVVDGATILVTSPTASTIVRPGSSMSIRWTSSEGVGDTVSIELMNGQSVIVTIVQKATNDGEFSWSVPSNIVEGLYTIRVRGVSEQAQGSTPTAFSISSAQAPTLPGVPQSLVPVAGGTSITLSWQAPVSNGGSPITGYRVYRATSEGGTYSLIASTSGRNYADANVAAGQVYWYRISALTAAGEGAPGAAFSATVAKTGSAGGNTLPIILAVVVVAIVLVVIVILVKRRASGRKRPPYLPAPGTSGPADPQAPSGNAVRSPPPAQAYSYCPSCGAQTHGSDVCRNCGKRVR